MKSELTCTLKPFFLVVDLDFILYWTVTLLNLIPEAYLFKDYGDSVLVAWNWSFLPLDLFISATGLGSLYLLRRGNPSWRSVALISLVLTFCSGYHMNKRHWNTVVLDGSVPEREVLELIDLSHTLVVKGLKKVERERLAKDV